MQLAQAEAFKKLEGRLLPEGLDYNEIGGLRLEARQKLAKSRPENLGQASRITGVSPADINVLLVYLKTY
jgi:tRNA uridine 5-carboxymethylaminomethyl modification enzyme